MSSSTSSSDRTSGWRVAAAVALALVAAELAVRVGQERVSLDLRHLGEIPGIVERLAGADGARVLVLGNSLTRRGVDPARLAASLSPVAPVTAAAVYPDDTRAIEWDYLFRRSVPDGAVDVVVVPFANDHLDDGAGVNPRRLSRHFTALSDLDSLRRHDFHTFGEWAEFALARVSIAFAESERVRVRILNAVVPSYRESAQRLNQAVDEPSRPGGDGAGSGPGRAHLTRLVETIRDRGALPVVVAFPVERDYAVASDVPTAVEAGGGVFVDLRDLPGLEGRFPDGLHLDDAGSRLATDALAERLGRLPAVRRALAGAAARER